MMKTLTHVELINALQTLRGTAIVGLLALTDARARKNSLGQIFKQVRAVGFVGANYESAVNREATRQGGDENFESGKLPWGNWLVPNKVIEHKGVYYLRTQSTPGQRRFSPARVLSYRNSEGQFLSPEIVKPLLPEKVESKKQQIATGIEKTVWVNTYKFDSIQKIRIAGQTYRLAK
jgi:hypothetical protein